MAIGVKRTKRTMTSEKVSCLRTWAVLTLATLSTAVFSPGVASACSVCTAGREEENQLAFLLSTIFMSLLPLIVIGTLVFVLWRRIRRLEEEESARSAGISAAGVSSGRASQGELGYRTGSSLG